MAAKKDKMIPSEKERKRALKYATPAGTGRMWVTMGSHANSTNTNIITNRKILLNIT